MFGGTQPPRAEFEHAATASEVRVIQAAVLRFSRPNSPWSAELSFEFSPTTEDQEISRLAAVRPVALWEVGFGSICSIENRPFTVAELLLMTYVDDGLWLEGRRIECDDEDWSGYSSYWVVSDGHKVPPYDFLWLRRGGVFEALMTLSRHDLTGQDPRGPSGLGSMLRDEPERVAKMTRAFIERFGYEHAKTLLGAENLEAALAGTLWEKLDGTMRVCDGQFDLKLSG